MILNPKLKGKAFAVGRENTKKGVLSTASYEARKYGINSGMAVIDAYKILPSLIVVHVDYNIIHEYSKKFFNLIREYQKDIEQTSVDECFIDVTNITTLVGRHPLELAKEIQKRALDELKLPCSIGIAPTLYLAKMASDMKKPLGITILRKRDIKEKLYKLRVKDIYGIGKKTWPVLEQKGIYTIEDFLNPDNKGTVLSVVGQKIYHYEYEALTGNSTNIVDPNRYSDPESISRSQTFDTPLSTYDEVLKEIKRMMLDVYNDMIKENKKAKTVGIILRDKSFVTITRSKSLDNPTFDIAEINEIIEELVDINYDEDKLYRLVGASLSNLKDINYYEPEEITLFNYEKYYEKELKIQDVINKIGADKVDFLKNKT